MKIRSSLQQKYLIYPVALQKQISSEAGLVHQSVEISSANFNAVAPKSSWINLVLTISRSINCNVRTAISRGTT